MRNQREERVSRFLALLSVSLLFTGMIIMLFANYIESDTLLIIGGNIQILCITAFGLILWIEEPAPVDERDRTFIGIMVLSIAIGFFVLALSLFPWSKPFWGWRSIIFFLGTGIVITFSGFLKDHLLGLKVIYRFDQVEVIQILFHKH